MLVPGRSLKSGPPRVRARRAKGHKPGGAPARGEAVFIGPVRKEWPMGLARALATATVQVPGQVDPGRKRWARRRGSGSRQAESSVCSDERRRLLLCRAAPRVVKAARRSIPAQWDLVRKVRLFILERVLKAHRKCHEKRHCKKSTHGTPEPRAKCDREENSEGVDLKTSAHQGWR